MKKDITPQLEPGWQKAVGDEFAKPYMARLGDFLAQEYAEGQIIFPPQDDIYRALHATPFERVRVVILGQDPYHGAGQAHGLSFSVKDGVALPPSLMNIYKEIERSTGAKMPRSGDLSHWAAQGVLLLNATLTVRAAQAGSHQKKGWEDFTDAVIRAVNNGRDNVVFMLWGAYAQKKGAFIDRTRHLVLAAPHPSPLSAHRGFIGCGHFTAVNEYLARHGQMPVIWAPVAAAQGIKAAGN